MTRNTEYRKDKDKEHGVPRGQGTRSTARTKSNTVREAVESNTVREAVESKAVREAVNEVKQCGKPSVM